MTNNSIYSIYQSFRKPDKDKDKANPWYQNSIDKLKQSYNKANDKVDKLVRDSFMSKLYSLPGKFNLAYLGAYDTPNNLTDYERKAQITSGYKFRHSES